MPIPKLGKQKPRYDPRTLRMAEYLMPGLPAPPAAVDWTARATAPWGMLANDSLGDCTCAAALHMLECWSANVATELVFSNTDAIAAYSAITGYTPSNPASDQGAVEIDVLNYWRNTGIGGFKIASYVAMNPGNTWHIKQGIALFGGAYIGLALPITAQSQETWDVAPVVAGEQSGDASPGSWGGHAVNVVGYDDSGLTVITWGVTKRMTWSFWCAYCDEAYAVLSEDWLGAGGQSPEGFDLQQLQADLAEVAG